MKINRRKIINPNPYLRFLDANQRFYIGIRNLESHEQALRAIGYFGNMAIGTRFIPLSVGNVSGFNLRGKIITRKDKEKSWQYRDGVTTDWHGNEHNVTIRYWGYPKEELQAPEIEFEVAQDDTERFIISPLLINSLEHSSSIKHIINLFLEIFGECELLYENLIPVFNNARRLSWNILPGGEHVWETVEERIQNIIRSNPNEEDQGEITSRMRKLSDSNPDFVAFGAEGFNGYVVFAFNAKKTFILESIYSGNATYVFGDNWEELSKMTKAQILHGNLQRDRIIHNYAWEARINHLLG